MAAMMKRNNLAVTLPALEDPSFCPFLRRHVDHIHDKSLRATVIHHMRWYRQNTVWHVLEEPKMT